MKTNKPRVKFSIGQRVTLNHAFSGNGKCGIITDVQIRYVVTGESNYGFWYDQDEITAVKEI